MISSEFSTSWHHSQLQHHWGTMKFKGINLLMKMTFKFQFKIRFWGFAIGKVIITHNFWSKYGSNESWQLRFTRLSILSLLILKLSVLVHSCQIQSWLCKSLLNILKDSSEITSIDPEIISLHWTTVFLLIMRGMVNLPLDWFLSYFLIYSHCSFIAL